MIRKKVLVGCVSLFLIVILAACSGNTEETSSKSASSSSGSSHNMDNMDMSSGSSMDMDMHSDSGKVPGHLKSAKNPAFKVGSKAVIHANHMPGMNSAEATIVGAYDTTVYAVSYTPTTGGERVTNHKWVIQEDIQNAGDTPFKPGEKVTLAANHMKGMKGAKATVDSAKHTTVYMVNYMPTNGGKEVTNHQWLTEDELSAN